jgi:hypothetical protein
MTHALLTSVLIGENAPADHSDFQALRKGMDLPNDRDPRKHPSHASFSQSLGPVVDIFVDQAFGALTRADGLALVATLYTCAGESSEDVWNRLDFTLVGDDLDDISVIFAQVFRLRVLRWLKGTGHPVSAAGVVVDLDLFNTDQGKDRLRAEMLVLAVHGGRSVPASTRFKARETDRMPYHTQNVTDLFENIAASQSACRRSHVLQELLG